MISTPYLDAAPLSPRDREKFEVNKKAVEQGLADQKIWNVDYEDAKSTLKNIIERQCDRLWNTIADDYRNLSHDNPLWLQYYENVSMFFDWTGAPKRLRGLNKMQMNPKLEQYKALIEDGVTLGNALKQLKPFVVKGRKPSENPKEVDLTNTGTCSVCMKRQKLDFGARLVAHGYTIRWGGRNGICFGAGHKAWELSPEGAEAYRENLKEFKGNREETLERLNSLYYDKLSEMVRVRRGPGEYEDEKRTYDKGTPDYERVRKTDIAEAERDIRMLTSDIAELDKRIAGWKPEPLKYGGAETQERWKSKLLQNPKK